MNYEQNLDGYKKIAEEIAVLKKYAVDRSKDRGGVERIVDRIHPKRLRLRVSEVRPETASATTLRLVSEDGYLPPFMAGQYINFFVKIDQTSTARPYSLSSSPAQTAYYDITVRRVEDGLVSGYLLDEVKTGDTFESTAPSGNFYFNPLFHGKDQVFIAGGSGVTPFMSMIREVTDRGLDRKIHLIYGSRDPEDIIFREELEERAKNHPNFSFTPVISEPPPGFKGRAGLITGDLIRDVSGPEADSKMFYICGPEAMYGFCLPELEKLGIPPKRLRREVFGTPKDVCRNPGWPATVHEDSIFRITITGGGSFSAQAKESILTSLERAGYSFPNSCRSGECSLCRMKLMSGHVFQPQGAKLRKSDRQFGYVHACSAFPLSDLEIMI